MVFLAALMVLSLVVVGCGGTQQAEEPAGEPSSEQQSEQPASKYPEKPITCIVAWSAGGGTDVGVRIFLKYVEKYFDGTFVVKNVEGAGGEIGLAEVKNSPPDGYTIGTFNNAHIIIAASREAQYHPIDDFEHIANTVEDPRMFNVRWDDDRFPDGKAFIDYARANPDKLTVGTSGANTSGHFTIEIFNDRMGVKLKPVHFDGAAKSKAAFLGKHIDSIGQTVGEVMPMWKEKQARPVLVAASERLPEFPDAQTFKEHGLDFTISSRRGFAAPKGTPKEYIDILVAAFEKAVADPEFLAEMENMGLPVKFEGPEELRKNATEEFEMYKEIIAKLNS